MRVWDIRSTASLFVAGTHEGKVLGVAYAGANRIISGTCWPIRPRCGSTLHIMVVVVTTLTGGTAGYLSFTPIVSVQLL